MNHSFKLISFSSFNFILFIFILNIFLKRSTYKHYYNYIKIRDLDDLDTPRLYCDILNPEYEDKANKIMQENIKPAPSFSTPIFNSTPVFEKEAPIIPASLNDAFGTSFQDNKKDEPF